MAMLPVVLSTLIFITGQVASLRRSWLKFLSRGEPPGLSRSGGPVFLVLAHAGPAQARIMDDTATLAPREAFACPIIIIMPAQCLTQNRGVTSP